MGRPKRGGGGGSEGEKRSKSHFPESDESAGNSDSIKHPLLNYLVLKNVFEYSKILDPEFKSYRLVCKTWDVEVLKKIRPSTKINVARIISPIPDGLGWTEDNMDNDSYQTPCPFENVEVNGTCENLQDTRLIKWFQVIGGNVKFLQFDSGLTCYHQVRFLECVLKQWCPNLNTLFFNGVNCLVTLLYTSKCVDPGSILCSKNLKELIISVDGESVESQFNNCQDNLPQKYLNSDVIDLTTLVKFEKARMINQLAPFFVSSLLIKCPNILINEGSDDSTLWTTNPMPPISQLGSLEFQLERSETDGGVLGQILKDAVAVDSMAVRNMPGGDLQWKELIGFLHCRPNSLKKTLKKFQCTDLPILANDTVLLFQLLRYPLTSLKIDLTLSQNIACIRRLHRFLSTFSGTLEHLELRDLFTPSSILSTDIFQRVMQKSTMKLPIFPKLKQFVNRSLETCPFSGFDFLPGTMPNLEKCTLLRNDDRQIPFQIMASSLILENTARHFRGQNIPGHPLKQMSMNLLISQSSQMDILMRLLPSLCKVDLVISDSETFAQFFRLSNSTCLEDVKISFSIVWGDGPPCEEALIESMRTKERLKFMELVHNPDKPAVFTEAAFSEGFAKAPKLTSLKLTNFGIFGNVEPVRESLKHLCCVKFDRVMFMQKFDSLEYSSGQST